jgi:hypothetical protein
VSSDGEGNCEELQFDFYTGARYYDLDVKVRQEVQFGSAQRTSAETEHFDLLFGLGFQWDMTTKLTFAAKGDVGGFGLGDSSPFAWQAQGTFSYHVSELFSVILGCRYLHVDTVTGSGQDKKGVQLDFTGPIIGVGFTF